MSAGHLMLLIVQRSIRNAYWQYIEGIITSKDDNSPADDIRFWRFVKLQKQEAQVVASLKKDGKLTDDPSEKASILKMQFQSVFSTRNHLSPKALCTRATNFIKPDGTPNETPQRKEYEEGRNG